jgi:anti-sigma factor RsiW
MDCRQVRTYVDLFIDDELELRDRVDVEGHLDLCANCNRFVARETSLRAALRAKLATPPAPAALRASILKAIANEPVERVPRLWDRLAAGFAWSLPAALATAIALIVVWPFESRDGGSAAMEASMLPTGAAADAGPRAQAAPTPLHRAVTLASFQGLGADVSGPEHEIQRYFESRVPFTVSLPLLPNVHVRLVGAREVVFDGRAGAMLIYTVGSKRLTVIQTAATDLEVRSPELVVARDGAMTTGRFVRDSRLNTVISDVAPAELVKLIDAAQPGLEGVIQ